MNIPLFKTNIQPSQAVGTTSRDTSLSTLNTTFTRVTEPLVLELRYNPDRDTGKDNYVYLQSIERDTLNFAIPDDKDIQITGLPLHIAMWGWLDWQKKLAKYHQIDTSYSLVIRTPVTEPKVDYIIPIDQNFLDGKGPYGIPHTELNTYTLTSWWPKVAHQLVTNNNICHSGPATCKYEKVKAIQAHCKYSFYFKWGGCPAPMVDLTNPCSQPKYPLPDPIVQRLQIQNPETPPQLELHDFDQRQEQITKRCIERIQQYTTTEQSLSTITGPTIPPTKTQGRKYKKKLETPEEEKRKRDTTPPAQTAAPAAAAPQASTPQTNVRKYRITMSNCKVSMFPECNQPKNRRLTPAELEDDLFFAKMFKRPLRHFVQDKPFYPYVPTDPFNQNCV